MINEILKLVIGPLSGAALALIVNRLFEIRIKKPKLVFGIRYDHELALDHSRITDKQCGYQLFCVNIGQVPFFIQKVIFYNKNYKKDFFLEVYPEPKNELSAILPFTPTTYSLSFKALIKYLIFVKGIKN